MQELLVEKTSTTVCAYPGYPFITIATLPCKKEYGKKCVYFLTRNGFLIFGSGLAVEVAVLPNTVDLASVLLTLGLSVGSKTSI